MRMPKLSDAEISRNLSKLPGWLREGDALTKTYVFENFTQSLEFVNEVGESAEAVKHHPDIDIRYNKVTLTLTTHDSSGITQKDIDMAVAADGFADAISE